MRKIVKMKKYGAEVYADEEGEAVRKDICLCLHCARLATEDDVRVLQPTMHNDQLRRITRAFNCHVAQRLFEICQEADVATPVTRCPMFVEKDTA